MSEQLWRFPRTIQIAFFTPHCTMPTLIHIICALAKCTLSDPSPCKTLQEESVAPCLLLTVGQAQSLCTNIFAKWEGRNKPNNNSPPLPWVERERPCLLPQYLRLSWIDSSSRKTQHLCFPWPPFCVTLFNRKRQAGGKISL